MSAQLDSNSAGNEGGESGSDTGSGSDTTRSRTPRRAAPAPSSQAPHMPSHYQGTHSLAICGPAAESTSKLREPCEMLPGRPLPTPCRSHFMPSAITATVPQTGDHGAVSHSCRIPGFSVLAGRSRPDPAQEATEPSPGFRTSPCSGLVCSETVRPLEDGVLSQLVAGPTLLETSTVELREPVLACAATCLASTSPSPPLSLSLADLLPVSASQSAVLELQAILSERASCQPSPGEDWLDADLHAVRSSPELKGPLRCRGNFLS